jgi:DNA-binding CsgD family transcriptional regulator
MKLIIRKNSLPYIITWIFYYAWVIVFTTWWASSPITNNLMGANSRVILHSLNLVSSALFICIIKREWFKRTSYIGGFFVLLFSVLSMLNINDIFHIISIILLSISLGIVNISILIPMIYILNNNEKLLSIVGSNLLISILVYFQETSLLTIKNGLVFSFIMLLISLFPIIFFNLNDLESERKKIVNSSKKLNKIMLLSIILNCVYAILCKGIGKAFVMTAINNSLLTLNPIYYIGAIFGCLLSFFINKLNKLSNYVLWNIIFGLFAISMFIYSVASSPGMYYVFGFIMGMVSTMGMINMYYALGVIGKKYWNHFFVKLTILFVGILGGVGGTIFGKIFNNINKTTTSSNLSIISVVVIIIFLMISPSLSNTYYNDEIDTKERKDNIIKNKFKKYKLTNKEEELCKILIEGYTLRQASAMMGIRYFTANSYYKNIYKKTKYK